MEERQVEVAIIKQFAENNILQKSLLITFNGEVKHRIGNLKARKIIDKKTETIEA